MPVDREFAVVAARPPAGTCTALREIGGGDVSHVTINAHYPAFDRGRACDRARAGYSSGHTRSAADDRSATTGRMEIQLRRRMGRIRFCGIAVHGSEGRRESGLRRAVVRGV